jgi:hypothetical protein
LVKNINLRKITRQVFPFEAGQGIYFPGKKFLGLERKMQKAGTDFAYYYKYHASQRKHKFHIGEGGNCIEEND